SPAQQLVDTFGRDHGARIELSPPQLDTLASILASDGRQLAEVYMGLAAVGIALVPRDQRDSWERVKKLLDAAYQVWAGVNVNHPVPEPRVTREQAQRTGKPVDTIPGTEEAWTARGVAERLDKKKNIVEMMHGLNLSDRIAVSEELARIRAGRGDRRFADPY